MTRFKRLALGLLAALGATDAAAFLQPGLYDVRLQLVLPNTALQLPARHHRVCLGEREILSGSAYALSETGRFCGVTGLRTEGPAVRYGFVCDTAGSARMAGRAEGTRQPAGYDVVMTGRFVPATAGLDAFTQTLIARRVGACP